MIEGVAVRYHVTAKLAGRPFEEATADVGFGDPFVPEPDLLPGTTLLEFAGIERLTVPTVALEQHIAEKLHAYARTYGKEGSTRVKDLIDLVLAAEYGTPHSGRLRLALQSTFRSRGAHSVLDQLPSPPNDWAVSYRKMAQETGMPLKDALSPMRSGYERVARFLQPILEGTAPEEALWDPATQQWSLRDPSRM